MTVTVIGAGLAGCECALALAKKGIKVKLYEMKPEKYSPAHKLSTFAELVCSNSLRGAGFENAPGLLKEEMRRLGSVVCESADTHKVPAGGALAVDREKFSQYITDKIKENENIEIIYGEVDKIPEDGYTVIATGPLTSDKLSEEIRKLIGEDYLHFFDAAAPVVTYESVDFDSAFMASRYDKGEADYINCPMSKEEYDVFYNELINAECAQLKEFENHKVFEGCMPVEVMAKRGEKTLLFGPLKPVGLKDPRSDKEHYAVVQLRQDNKEKTLYNIVGFQTHLKFNEQKRVFGLIPALKNAEYARYGVMHRNTFLNSPKLLDNSYRLKKNPNIFFAGQITGVEGYVESAASGLAVGIYLSQIIEKGKCDVFSRKTAMGALSRYVSDETVVNFQPMNINFGIIDPLEYRVKGKKEKNTAISMRALEEIDRWKEENKW
ncbi:MAG: methylenetetrahydrofolate--tRNA-(uracil(54)-C(5))-methyltransferase (FADH(2)-oxidizing) TrmFO [Clostridia bacterium]|nr:methylenetetrahydrofolate--tRNA-(uracil(54)-C(5))-methyltransferase (FADH(2)-oxidizing) TrmFO [Clostridia bacterium]